MTGCVRCRESLPAGARFCPGCGCRVPSAPGRPSRGAPRDPLPSHRPEFGEPEPSGPIGDRKHLTVLFADVTASMDVFSHHDAEDAAALFDQVLERMSEAVERYEGTVNQVLGDGIMALFGAPVAHEDHAVRACYAALRMVERVTSFGDAVQRSHGFPIQIRIGLNSGEVVVRASSGDDRRLSVVGQVVHMAARMEQVAKPGSIAAAATTVQLTAGRIRTVPLGPIRVKGLDEPIEVHEIVGAAAGSLSAFAEPQARHLTPFVGRQRELEQLVAALRAVRGGPGGLVAVAGEPGIGKTRLLQEFLPRCRVEGARVLAVGALPYTRATGAHPGQELVRAYFGLEPSEGSETIRVEVLAGLRAVGVDTDEHLAPILWQLGVLQESSPFRQLDADVRLRRAVSANFAIIQGASRQQPFVIAIENMQWADSTLEDALKRFVLDLPTATLIFATYRPGYDDRWLLAAGAARLHLEALPPDMASVLLDGLLGRDPSLHPLKKLLSERTGGNPLFLEESVRELVQSGVLAREGERYWLAHPVASIKVPATVRSLVEARVDRLSEHDRHVLQCSAVIGEQVPAGLLEATVDSSPASVRASIERLRAMEFLDDRPLFPEPIYVFRHALTHDVAYGTLLHEARQQLHARVLAALEQGWPDDRPGLPEQRAYHAFAGGVWDRAVQYGREAAARTGLGAREAIGFLENALAALARLPDGHGERELAVDIRHQMCALLIPQGEHRRMLAVLREAETLATGLGDDARLVRTLALLCTGHWEVGNTPEALATGARAVSMAERLGDPGLELSAKLSLGGAVRAIGRYRQAAELFRSCLGLAETPALGGPPGGVGAVRARAHLAWSLAELGEFPEAIRVAEEGVRLAQAAQHPYGLALAHLGLGGTFIRQGSMAKASVVLERGLMLTRDAPFLHPPMAADLAVTYALAGRHDAGIELGEEAVRRAEEMGRLGRLSLIVTHLGELYFLAGRRQDALAQAGRALRLASERMERGNEVYARRLLGLIAAESDPPDVLEAHAQLGQALALAETLGMRPLLARCHLVLGRLARRHAEAEGAARHLDSATRLLRAMEMEFWLNRRTLDRIGGVGGAE